MELNITRIKFHPLYETWKRMRYRCNKKTNKDYAHYGGRGITVCKEWNESFMSFLKDMGERPSKEHTIDRINNDGPYSKENCRWATKLQQTINRRIFYECYKGHPWTASSTINTHNGNRKTRRCRICYEARGKKKEEGGE